jgi:hypothetical protein
MLVLLLIIRVVQILVFDLANQPIRGLHHVGVRHVDLLRLAGLFRRLCLLRGSLLLGLVARVIFIIHVVDVLPLIDSCGASLLRLFSVFSGVLPLVAINLEITVLSSSASIHGFLFQAVHLLILIVPLAILLIGVLPGLLHLGSSPVRSALCPLLLILVVVLTTDPVLLDGDGLDRAALDQLLPELLKDA